MKRKEGEKETSTSKEVYTLETGKSPFDTSFCEGSFLTEKVFLANRPRFTEKLDIRVS